MKKLTIAALLMLAATTTQARTLMYMPNEGGGRIFLTDEVCKGSNGKTYNNLRRIFTYVSNGATQEGCWYYEEETELVHAVWRPNTRRVYPLGNFTLIESKQPATYKQDL